MTDMLTQVHDLQQMLATNPLATMLGFLLIAFGVVGAAGWQFYRDRVRRGDEVADRKGIVDLATTFSTALSSQTEINRQQASQMEAIGHGIRDMARTVSAMHKSNQRYFKTQDGRLSQIEEDIRRLKEAA